MRYLLTLGNSHFFALLYITNLEISKHVNEHKVE